MHQSSHFSAMTLPFQPQATLPTPRLSDTSRGHQVPESGKSATDLSQPQGISNPSRGRSPSPALSLLSQPSDDGDLTTDGGSTDYDSPTRSAGVEVVETVNPAREIRVLATLVSPLPLTEEGERRMGFPVKSKFLLSVVVTPMM